MDYKMIIIEGWIKDVGFLTDYFYREIKKAESDGISWNEFYEYCKIVFKYLREKIDESYYKQLEMWNKYLIQQSKKGLEVEIQIPEKFDSGFPLLFLTENKYTGHIWGKDIDYIESCLADAVLKRISENDKSNKYNNKKEYKELRDIFINNDAFKECINALKAETLNEYKKTLKPVIDNDNNYLLGERMKGVFAAWYEVLKQRGKVKTVSNRIMAELLNKEFKGLNLYEDGGILGDLTTTHCKKYYTPFSQLIKQLPLSTERR